MNEWELKIFATIITIAFSGVGAGLPHDVSLVGSHAPRRPQFRQSKSRQRPVAAHRKTRLLS